MAADTYDSILGLILMGTGNDNNAWGVNLNNSMISPAARAICGVNTITATSGTVDLSTVVPPAGMRLDIDHIQLLTGALTADLTVKVVNQFKKWRFENKTTGAFNVYVQVPGGVSGSVPGIGGLIQIPQGKSVDVTCDGAGNLYRGDRHEIGTLIHHAGATAPAGSMIANGASLLRTEFPDLFLAHGTTWGSVDGTHFTLPKLTDTNRYLRAADGATITVGTYQSNQNAAHTHTVTGAPGAGTLSTDTQGAHVHAATPSDPTHSHSVPSVLYSPAGGASPNFSSSGSGSYASAPTTAVATGISVSIGSAGSHAHNITGAPSVGTLGTASQGGTEARPESAAVLICIRY